MSCCQQPLHREQSIHLDGSREFSQWKRHYAESLPCTGAGEISPLRQQDLYRRRGGGMCELHEAADGKCRVSCGCGSWRSQKIGN